MISPTRIPLPESFGPLTDGIPDLVTELLASQQSLTAVERFSQRHDEGTDTDTALENKSFYRDLIPLRDPVAGEQYAFEVDLDRCTGCKACVTACHNLNGLDEDETWRSVGVLQSASPETNLVAAMAETLQPVQQHVTTACHHCADPGCAQGCPTLAYEKDATTGVVRHLDDQCFGCQYCILKCPYDVPQYSAKRGIVRKCDLCIGRLRAGEAPACAQACPTQAIRVTLVETAALLNNVGTVSNAAAPAAHFDLPGAPDPARVMPTTRYRSTRGLPEGMTPADVAQVKPEHAHLPLVLMLVASQAAAGYWILFALNTLYSLSGLAGVADSASRPFPWLDLVGVAGVQGALGLSLLHLGRPWLAWKAFLGWRRSWLSREVIAFSALAGTTTACAGLSLMEWFAGVNAQAFGFWEAAGGPVIVPFARAAAALSVILSALAAIYASAMVYRDTPRVLWANRDTLWRFALTGALCGIPLFAGVALIVSGKASSGTPAPAAWTILLALSLLPLFQIAKLALEMRIFLHRHDGARGDFNPLWKATRLLDGRYRAVWRARATLGFAGGVFLPLTALLTAPHFATDILRAPLFAACFALVLTGELLERFLFFTTAVAPRMPGGRS